jgi:hypothetical protein
VLEEIGLTILKSGVMPPDKLFGLGAVNPRNQVKQDVMEGFRSGNNSGVVRNDACVAAEHPAQER